MTRQKRVTYLILPILALALAALACSGGYSTTSKISGNSGEVRVKTGEADGSDTTSVELNEDWMRDRVFTTVSFSLEGGTCRATLVGEENTRIELNASAGSPAQASGYLVTDGFGEVDLETNCQGGQNLELLINFTLQ
jgi:glycerate-2-kinase